MWKPENSFHKPWVEISEGSCPQLQPTATPTLSTVLPTSTPTPTIIIPVTGETPTPGSSEVVETIVPVIVEGFSIPVTGDICDICLEERRQADALESIANSLATMAAESAKP